MTALPLIHPNGYTTVELDATSDWIEALELDEWAFAMHYPDQARETFVNPLEAGRAVGVRDSSGALVGVHSSYEGELHVPGGRVAASGLTWVGVHPGHRRRGIATAMLTSHLQRTAARGECISVLFAAEPEIYGRYGYGLAATDHSATLGRGVTLREVPGTESLTTTLERADAAQHAGVVSGLMTSAARPGHFAPTQPAHLANHFVEVEAWREGRELRRIAIVRDGEGDPRAFALFRRREKWEDSGPSGTVELGPWAALDGAAAHALFTTLTNLDLMGSVKVGGLTMDSPVLRQLVNLRSAALKTADNLWLRLVDLPAALTARTYARDAEVVLEVTDAVLPDNAGRWRLVVNRDGRGQVSRTEDAADLTLTVADLASTYLGGVTLASLVAAGLATTPADAPDGHAERVARASIAFSTPLAPVCAWGF